MNTRALYASLGVAVILLTGYVRSAAAGDQVPIHGYEEGQVFITGIPDPANPTVASVVYTTEGIASHLGRYRFIGHNLADFAWGCTRDGVFEIVTASGDRLFGTYDLCFDVALAIYTETLQITGGTGRFNGATGTLYSDGIYLSLTDPVLFVASWKGAISTPGSNKR